VVQAGLEMEEAMWKKQASIDGEKIGICTKNGM